MNLWPKFFVESPWPDGFVKDLSSLLVEFPYNRELEASDYLQKITTTDVAACDKFGWPLSLNGVFSVKSYIFLNDGGICCRWQGSSGVSLAPKNSVCSIGWHGKTRFSL